MLPKQAAAATQSRATVHAGSYSAANSSSFGVSSESMTSAPASRKPATISSAAGRHSLQHRLSHGHDEALWAPSADSQPAQLLDPRVPVIQHLRRFLALEVQWLDGPLRFPIGAAGHRSNRGRHVVPIRSDLDIPPKRLIRKPQRKGLQIAADGHNLVIFPRLRELALHVLLEQLASDEGRIRGKDRPNFPKPKMASRGRTSFWK